MRQIDSHKPLMMSSVVVLSLNKSSKSPVNHMGRKREKHKKIQLWSWRRVSIEKMRKELQLKVEKSLSLCMNWSSWLVFFLDDYIFITLIYEKTNSRTSIAENNVNEMMSCLQTKIFYLLFIVIRCSSNLNCYWSSHVFCGWFLHIITTTIHLSSFDKSITEVSSIRYSIALLTIVFLGSFPLSVSLSTREIS